jgi:hypothetical protein
MAVGLYVSFGVTKNLMIFVIIIFRLFVKWAANLLLLPANYFLAARIIFMISKNSYFGQQIFSFYKMKISAFSQKCFTFESMTFKLN